MNEKDMVISPKLGLYVAAVQVPACALEASGWITQRVQSFPSHAVVGM